MQLSVPVTNAILDAIEATVGPAPLMRFLSGPPEASPASPQSGTLIAEMVLPSDWLAAAASGQKSMLGQWAIKTSAAGTIGHFRILNAAGTVAHILGNVTTTGGGGDIEMDNPTVANNRWLIVDAFDLVGGNL